MPVIESCILDRRNFGFLWQLKYDRWMTRTRVIESLLVGPRYILKHHELSQANFHNRIPKHKKGQDNQENTHYCSYFISVYLRDLSQISRNKWIEIWSILIPISRVYTPKSTPSNGIQRNLGKFKASWAFNAIDGTHGEPAWDCSCVIGIFHISSLLQLAGNMEGHLPLQ